MFCKQTMAGMLMLTAINSHAINVTEGSGNFSDFSSDGTHPTFVGTLDRGANSISGLTSYIGPDGDVDNFSFDVPYGSKITSIIVDYVSDDHFFVEAALWETPKDGSSISLGGFRIGDIDWQVYNKKLPSGTDILSYFGIDGLESDRYRIGLVGFTKENYTDKELDYTFTANAVPVPAPPTIWMYGTGLACLFISTRRRRT